MKTRSYRAGYRLLVPLLAVFLAATGCGGGSEEGDPGAEKEEAPIAFARCMREEGIDAPDPPPAERGFGFVQPGPGDDEAKFDAARKKCQEEVEANFEFLSEDQALLFDNLVLFARCMRGKGIDFPDPDQSTDRGAGEYIKRVSDPGDPQFEEADDECRIEVRAASGGPAEVTTHAE
jgi:hypothetical protein